MRSDFDPRLEAQEAMRQAVAAANALDRAKWLRVALAWQALANAREWRGADSPDQSAA
jgi:hypothetical protein